MDHVCKGIGRKLVTHPHIAAVDSHLTGCPFTAKHILSHDFTRAMEEWKHQLLPSNENAAMERENEMDQLRQSMDRVSMLIKARKAGQNWRSKSSGITRRRSGDDHESQHESSHSSNSRPSWRQNLGAALDSTPTHVTIVSLLLIDLLATAVDLLLTIHNTSADLRECSASIQSCQCDPAGFNSGREPWEFLHWISVGILGILMLNVLGLMLAFGFSFFTHAGYVLDLFVVTSALVLEVFFEADTAGLLIILNLWRIVRVAHGIFEVTDEAWETEIEDLKERIEGAEERLNRECGDRDRRIQQLEAQLAAAKSQNQDDVS